MKTFPKRYEKQIALAEIGVSGQQKLADAKVLIIGAGGLGCPVLQQLAAAGVGCLGIVDGDAVEESNLHRQVLYTPEMIGTNKAESAASVIASQNTDIKAVVFPQYFSSENATEILKGFDLVADCTDNTHSRYLINDVALAAGVPVVYASIHKFEGQLSVFNYKGGPSYRCLFPQNTVSGAADCDEAGVLGVIPNILGTMQAAEILKIILGIGEVLSGKLLVYDVLGHRSDTIHFERNAAQIGIGLKIGQAILNNKNPEIGSVNAAAFYEALHSSDTLLIDIREIYETPELSFKAINRVPLSALDAFLEDKHKDQTMILLCQHGNRSALAAEYLTCNGFTAVSHLKNGIEALEQPG